MREKGNQIIILKLFWISISSTKKLKTTSIEVYEYKSKARRICCIHIRLAATNIELSAIFHDNALTEYFICCRIFMEYVYFWVFKIKKYLYFSINQINLDSPFSLIGQLYTVRSSLKCILNHSPVPGFLIDKKNRLICFNPVSLFSLSVQSCPDFNFILADRFSL